MNSLIFLIFLIAISSAFVDHELILRRAKRQAVTYSDFRALQCSRGCVLEFKDTFEMMKSAKNAYTMNLFTQKKSVDKFCGTYNELDSCLAECKSSEGSHSDRIEPMLQMFDSFDIICKSKKKEFLIYIPCYAKSKRLNEQLCTSKCGDADQFQKEINQKVSTRFLSNLPSRKGIIESVNELMEETCDFASCHQRCQSRIIRKQCPGDKGEKAATFLEMFASNAISRMSNGLQMFAPQIHIPEDCLSRPMEEEEENMEEADDGFLF